MAQTLSIGLNHPIDIATPLVAMHKEDVIKLGTRLHVPLADTLSCMNPVGTLHCGLCSKCRERRDAFFAAGVRDPTIYANRPPR
jgi:7-cyano-7-deazaguanine synthase